MFFLFSLNVARAQEPLYSSQPVMESSLVRAKSTPEIIIIDPLMTPEGIALAQRNQQDLLEHSATQFGAFEMIFSIVALFSSLFLFWGIQLISGILLIKKPSLLLSTEQKKYWEHLSALKKAQWDAYKKDPQLRSQMKYNGYIFCTFASIGISMILGFSFLDTYRSEQKLQGATLQLDPMGLGKLYPALQLSPANVLLNSKGEPVGSWSATPQRINLHFEKHPEVLKQKQIEGQAPRHVSMQRTLQLRPTPSFDQWVALEQQLNLGLFYPKSNLPNYETVRAHLIAPELKAYENNFSSPRYD